MMVNLGSIQRIQQKIRLAALVFVLIYTYILEFLKLGESFELFECLLLKQFLHAKMPVLCRRYVESDSICIKTKLPKYPSFEAKTVPSRKNASALPALCRK